MSTAKKLINILKEDIKGPAPKASPTYFKLVEFFPLQPIASKSQHEMALKVLDKIISYLNEQKIQDKGAESYLKILGELVGDYEKNHFPSPAVNGTEMLEYLMEIRGLIQSDLSEELGGQPVVSKILRGERELNLRQIKALSKRFNVPAKVFL